MLFCKSHSTFGFLLLNILHKIKSEFNPNVTIQECTKSKVVILVDKAADGGIIYIQGQGSPCLQTTTSVSRLYEFHFDACSITYGTTFRVIVQQNPVIQTGFDKVIPVTCIADLTEIDAKGEIMPGDLTSGKGINVTTTPSAYLRIYSKSRTDISGGGVVNLNDSIVMSITLDDEFSDSYDIKVKDCMASMIKILDNECSVDMNMFPNFQRSTKGQLLSQFQAFQPTDLTGSAEVDVAFSCRVAICKGSCEETICGEIIGWGRKKRSAEKNEIDEVTCGTSIKVVNPERRPENQHKTEPFCIEPLHGYIGIAVTVLLFGLSWTLTGYLLSKRIQEHASEGERINVARAVGRRLTSMLNLPTGYDFKDGKNFQSIPDEYVSPPQRRKSVTTTKIEMHQGSKSK